MNVEIIEDNKDKILEALGDAVDRALEAFGEQAENFTKINLEGHIDTGLLRNSITHAKGGESAAISVYHADNARGQKVKNGKKLKTYAEGASTAIGYYTGTAPNEKDTMFVGTNVEYAPYVEYGHRLPSGGTVAGVHFLQRAIMDHKADYKRVMEAQLK